jgi:DNA-binding transcriptional LysR family regulator
MDHKIRSKNAVLPSRRTAIELRHLRCVVTAADHGSFRRAAEALLLRQSTLSRCIRQLEERIGLTVFERSSGGAQTTLAGGDFLRVARSILEQMEALVATAQSTGQGTAGKLTLGFFTSLSAGNLRATLIDFRQRFPEIDLAMVENSRSRLLTALRHGGIDIAIATGDPPVLEGNAIPLWSERIMVILPHDHPLAVRDIVFWTDLRNETVLLSQYDQGRDLEDLLIAKLVSPGYRPALERHDVSRGVIKSLVSIGLGVSLITESDIGASLSGLVYREITDGTGPSRIGYSAYWNPKNNNPTLMSFLKMLSERYPLPV